jgi:addiction module RelE/StbE family toxin
MTSKSSVRHVVVTKTFERAARRATKHSSELAEQIRATVRLLQSDMSALALRSHKLKGELDGCWACSVNYSIRIVFEIGEPRAINGVIAETIVLLTIGTHDEVY